MNDVYAEILRTRINSPFSENHQRGVHNMNELLNAANKIKKYYYLPLLASTQLETINRFFIKGEPAEMFDEVENIVIDLVCGKFNPVEFFYEENERNDIKIHEDIKDGICYIIGLLGAVEEYNNTGEIPFYAANDLQLYEVVSNLDKLP